jgi:hypothetical protein
MKINFVDISSARLNKLFMKYRKDPHIRLLEEKYLALDDLESSLECIQDDLKKKELRLELEKTRSKMTLFLLKRTSALEFEKKIQKYIVISVILSFGFSVFAYFQNQNLILLNTQNKTELFNEISEQIDFTLKNKLLNPDR